jgi:hypothetical protein
MVRRALIALAAWAEIADASVDVTDPEPPGAALRVETRTSSADRELLTALTLVSTLVTAADTADALLLRAASATETACDSAESPWEMTESPWLRTETALATESIRVLRPASVTLRPESALLRALAAWAEMALASVLVTLPLPPVAELAETRLMRLR